MEMIFYQLVMIFQYPIYLLILLMFAFSLYDLGRFTARAINRARGRNHPPEVQGIEEFYLMGLKNLEIARLISRVAPLLGLVGTLIPLGPALVALAEGNTQELGRKLSFAFGAVSLSLISASITYYTSTIRRRWLLQDMKKLEDKS
ncbi:MAG: MotA/TolQ/ExbB proton channel family protein [Caldimicrobium sp.]|nr:MotA/TolQ/ExbB proton channel family protein [Caldimicrobium sp.]